LLALALALPAWSVRLIERPAGMPGPAVSPAAGIPAPAVSPAPGSVFILSAPSGTGKSTLAKCLLRTIPGLAFGVSHTTRPARPGEVNGVDYWFVDAAAFDQKLARGEFAEWVQRFGHRYGLDRVWLQAQLDAGKDVLLDLDPDGASAVRQARSDVVSVFLLPPSAEELARRLRGRGSEDERQIRSRLGDAKQQLSRFAEYDYLVVNRSPEQGCRELEAIILAARARRERRRAEAQRILAGF
jgi:guanylate kinase